MSTFHALLLVLAAWTGPEEKSWDVARLRETLLDAQNPQAQSQAALLLVQSKDSDAGRIIKDTLRRRASPSTILALTSALQTQRDGRFVEEIFISFQHGNLEVQTATASLLAQLADGSLLERLGAILQDSQVEWSGRQALVKALGRSQRREALEILVGQLTVPADERLRQAAAEALAEATGMDYAQDAQRWRSWLEARKQLSAGDWQAERLGYQTSLSRRLKAELDQTRSQLIQLHQQLYGRLPHAERLAYMKEQVDAADPAIRQLAVGWAVEMQTSADAVTGRAVADLLMHASMDAALEVQRSACLALGRQNDPRACKRLLQLIQDSSPPLRAAAARALALQVSTARSDTQARRKEIVSTLQKALGDSSLEVVIEAAEGLGTLGVAEANPVLILLLRHPSRSVRQTAAQALERCADRSVLEGLISGLDDPAPAVRFSLVGALGHACSQDGGLPDAVRGRVISRLEAVLVGDGDPGVRSRAATVLGECGTPEVLPALWRRVLANEDTRVQDKAFAAMVEILIRTGQHEQVLEWDRTLAKEGQHLRRIYLLGEAAARWSKGRYPKALPAPVQDALVQAHLGEGKWSLALPVLRDLLNKSATDEEVSRRLGWLLDIGRHALSDGKQEDALRAVAEAQRHLARKPELRKEFDKLEQRARQ